MGASKEHRRFRVITGAGAGLRRGSGRCGAGLRILWGRSLGVMSPALWTRLGRALKNCAGRLHARRRHDHPGSLLHLREDRGEQVGSLPGSAAGRVHRRVRQRAAGDGDGKPGLGS